MKLQLLLTYRNRRDMHPTYYSVIPVYSAGSPGQVDRNTAIRVAGQEKEARERNLSGAYGDDLRIYAERRGLSGIVYSHTEVRKGAVVDDLCTGARITFRRFPEFQAYSRALRAMAQRETLVLSDGARNESYVIVWQGLRCTPTFQSEGAAQVCLGMYLSGDRAPEL